jgi:hypothetical protein
LLKVLSLEQVVNSLKQENTLLNRGIYKLVASLQEEKQKLAEVSLPDTFYGNGSEDPDPCQNLPDPELC